MSSVKLNYFNDPTGQLGRFGLDWNDAVEEATNVGDKANADRLRNFVLIYTEARLKNKTTKAVIDHLASINIWKKARHWNVYRFLDAPSLAYAARLESDGSVRIEVVSACYQYPKNSPQRWWKSVVEPRVLSLV